MNSLILYLLQSSISLIVLYGVYWLFLQKDTFFQINRIYLLFSVLFSSILPLFKNNLFFVDTSTSYYIMLEAITVSAEAIEPMVVNNLDTFQIMAIVYLTGVVIFSLRFLIQTGQLLILVNQNGIQKQQGLNFVFINRNFAPFSFFHLIFLNKENRGEQNIKEIIAHEQVHCKQLHSIDIMILELLTIIQWFNPFVWFYRSSLKTVHEYLADEGVLLKGYNIMNYQNLLINLSIGVQVNDLTNNFNQSLIKKRIIMMTKNKSNLFAKLKLLMVTPVALLLVVALTSSPLIKTMAQDEKPVDVVVLEENQQDKPDDVIFTVVEKMPQFPGGDEARNKYIGSKVKYPDEARKAGKSGTVYVTYVVEKDGSITNAKVLRGFDKACDEMALNAIKEMPKWTTGEQRGKPVRVQFNMPISFKLDSDKDADKKSTQSDKVEKAPPSPKSPTPNDEIKEIQEINEIEAVPPITSAPPQ